MKISGFTIARNAVKLHYPIVESITSILPIVDEFVVNVGKSEDETLKLIQSIKSPKIKIVETIWDMSHGPAVLSGQTNVALKECKGDWAFYLQSDEVIHEADLWLLKFWTRFYLNKKDVDALRFYWFHFYGSHFRYRIDKGWYQKQDRIIRNNGTVESYGDAFAFRRKDGKPLSVRPTYCFLYHYGWTHSSEEMAERRLNAGEIWSEDFKEIKETGRYKFGDLDRFPVYFGSHPKVMRERIQKSSFSRDDLKTITKKYWWHPFKILKVRYKTPKRIKYAIE